MNARQILRSAVVVTVAWLAGHLTSRFVYSDTDDSRGGTGRSLRHAVEERDKTEHATEPSAAAPTLLDLITAMRLQRGASNPFLARSAALAAFFERLHTSEDFEKAMALLPLDLLDDSDGLNKPFPFGFAFFGCWAAIDRPAALRAASRVQATRLRDGFIETAVSEWAKTDPVGALDFVLSNPGPISANGTVEVIIELTKKDPVMAIRVLREHQSEKLVKDVVWIWTSKSYSAALQWSLAQPPSPFYLDNLKTVFLSYSQQHPEEALAQVKETVADPDAQAQVLKHLFKMGVDSTSPAKRLDLVLQFSEGTLRREILREIPGPAGEHVSEDVLKLAGTLTSAADRDAYICGQLRLLLYDVKKSSEQVVTLARTLPDGEDRTRIFSELSERWGQTAPEAASRWLVAQPPSADRDAAIEGFAPTLLRGDPEAALEWSASIANETLRSSGLRTQFLEWQAKDAASAQKWLEHSKLTEADKAALRNARKG